MTCPSIDHLKDEVSHHVPLEVREAVLATILVRHRVLHLNVEANVRREGAKYLQHRHGERERVRLGVVGVGGSLSHLLQCGEGSSLWTFIIHTVSS